MKSKKKSKVGKLSDSQLDAIFNKLKTTEVRILYKRIKFLYRTKLRK
jgi:hypothetical protein